MLLRKIKDAVTEKADHAWALVELELVVPPGDVEKWTVAVELWEHDNSATNPFVISSPSKDIMISTSIPLTNFLFQPSPSMPFACHLPTMTKWSYKLEQDMCYMTRCCQAFSFMLVWNWRRPSTCRSPSFFLEAAIS
jgi:hypothetical protein